MDLNGRNEINRVVAESLQEKAFGAWSNVTPAEHMFTDSVSEEESDETPVEYAQESYRYVDIHTHASPGRVLEALRGGKLLEGQRLRSEGLPQLRLLGIIGNGHSTTLTFEDMAQK